MPIKLLCLAMLVQETPQNEMKALLQEVRNLRETLDRTTFVGLRIQLVLHRLGQQQQIVSRAKDRLQTAEQRASSVRGQQERLDRLAKDLDQQKDKDPNMQHQVRMIRGEVESLPRQRQEFETAVLDSQQTLRMETAKLDELTRQLDELERRLAEISK
jgi:chromosome segregation ATPase